MNRFRMGRFGMNRFRMRLLAGLVLVFVISVFAGVTWTACSDDNCGSCDDCGPDTERNCQDGIDDDGDGLTDCEDYDCPVSVCNTAPTAVDDAVSTDEDTPVQINVLDNDEDVDGNIDPSTVEVIVSPLDGTTSVNPDTGVITYTPDPEFNGADSFDYRVCDDATPAGTVCDTAVVDVTINSISDPPVAQAQSVSTGEEEPLVITVTGSDGDGDALTISLASSTANGTLGALTQVSSTSATVLYTPGAAFTGFDAFDFTVDDGIQVPDTATINISVYGTAVISGTVFYDGNGDGVMDSYDVGLSGWSISLNNGDATALSDANGEYSFGGLASGSYTVTEIPQVGFTATTPVLVNVQISAGGHEVVDFGNRDPNMGLIYGYSWHDLNGNGVSDGGEPRLSGWTITLDSGSATAITDSNGDFVFPMVPAGMHSVTEIDATGFVSTTPNTRVVDVTGGQLYLVTFGNQ